MSTIVATPFDLSISCSLSRWGSIAVNEMNLERWPIFSLLDEEFAGTIKMVCVFGNNGNEAIVVDHDDDVYAIGSNSCCCLGFGYQTSTLLPRKVDALCKKDIKYIYNNVRKRQASPRPTRS
eukprot:sb/3475952/